MPVIKNTHNTCAREGAYAYTSIDSHRRLSNHVANINSTLAITNVGNCQFYILSDQSQAMFAFGIELCQDDAPILKNLVHPHR